MIPQIPSFRDAMAAWDIMLASHAGPAALAERRRDRLAALVAFARARSPHYRDLYRDLPDGTGRLDALPVMTKTQLMADFDRWVTDPAASHADVRAFVADRSHIGSLYLDRYAVWRSSGTTGHLGLFLHDRAAVAIYELLFAHRAWTPMITRPGSIGYWLGGGRMACVTASEDHFAGIASWRRLAAENPAISALMRDFSVMMPIDRLVRALNQWQPAQLVGYPSILALLAHEQDAGRLKLAPALIFAGGECLDAQEHDLIESAFDCPVRGVYAAAECDYVAFGCEHRALHVNADWIILEPVDADYRPVAPGTPSQTSLVTNLANRIQPIIRYDLGDSITELAGPCPCGNPLPAIRVEGRREQVLRFPAADGRQVTILPMAITTVLELIAGLRRFQIVRTAEASISVGCEFEKGADRTAVRDAVRNNLAAFLADHGLREIGIDVEARSLDCEPESGKFRQVVSRVGS